MSLVKKPVITEEKLAANRRNWGLSQVPATPEGRERIGAAHLRQGLYAKAQEPALRALGEDPAEFEELLQEPDTDEDGASEEEKARGVVNSMRSVFGLGPIEHDVALLTPSGEQMVVRAEAPGEIEGPPEGEEGGGRGQGRSLPENHGGGLEGTGAGPQTAEEYSHPAGGGL